MISPHIIPAHWGQIGDQRDADVMRRWNPAYAKIVCVDEKPPYAEQLPAATKIIVRNHPMSELYGTRGLPNVALATKHGADHAAACKRMADYLATKGIAASRLLFEGLNEPHLWADEPPAMTAVYYKVFLTNLHTYGLHGAVGNFGVGWPGNGGVANAPVDWAFFGPAIAAMQPGDCLAVHEYWSLSGPQQNWGWWAGRFRQCPFKVPILVTECGIDTGVSGTWYGGWHDLPGGSFDDKARRYCDELWWYAEQCAVDGRVKAVFPFTWDIGGPEWTKFNIRDEVFLRAFWTKIAACPMPQPGTGGVPMPLTNQELDVVRNGAWLKLGIPFNPAAAFGQFARAKKLGNPVTPEFAMGGCTAQGFANGIIACHTGDWQNIQVLPW